MSQDWHVYCEDCAAVHCFNDANHREPLMATLIKHASAIAALDALMSEPGVDDIEFSVFYGRIDTSWFKAHLGHKLVPIDEYDARMSEATRSGAGY